MLERVAISVASLRMVGAAVLIALAVTGGIAFAPSGVATRDTRASSALSAAVRGEVCAFALAMPACWHTMVCADTIEWLVGTEAMTVGPPHAVVRARSLGLTTRYMLRERDVPPLALPR